MSPDDDNKDSFASLFEKQSGSGNTPRRRPFRPGERVKGPVVQITKDSVFIELEGRRQAYIEAAELRGVDGAVTVTVGQIVESQVIDAGDDIIRLGMSMGKPGNVAALEQARQAGLPVTGKVTAINKGGYEVDLGVGTRAFCPLSHIEGRAASGADPKDFVGQSLEFLVTEIKDGGKSVVVSRRALLQRQAEESSVQRMRDIVPGAVLKGTVSAVRDFGAFVDLGGVEGLLPRSELGRDKKGDAGSSLKPGDAVEVQVREIKDATDAWGKPQRKITLSLKGAREDAERAEFEASKATAPVQSFGTLGDLLAKFKK